MLKILHNKVTQLFWLNNDLRNDSLKVKPCKFLKAENTNQTNKTERGGVNSTIHLYTKKQPRTI